MRGRKKVKLTPLQRAILAFPGPDGLVSIRPMLGELWLKFPRESREKLIKDVGIALLKIRRLGGLYLCRQFGSERQTVKVDEWGDFCLSNFIVWNSSTQQWSINENQKGVDDILVQLSQGGADLLRMYELQKRERSL